MRTRIYYILVPIVALLSISACVEDIGNYDYVDLRDFYIDTTDFKSEYYAKAFNTLEVPSGVVYQGDESNLEFEWLITSTINEALGAPGKFIFDEKDLNTTITESTGNYILEFRATETTTGRMVAYQHDLTVEFIGAGMFVLYERDGLVDYGVIRPTAMLGTLDEDEVYLDLYNTANPDNPLTGSPVGLTMYKNDIFFGGEFVTLLADNDAVVMDTDELQVFSTYDDFFLVPPKTVNIEGYRSYYAEASPSYSPNYDTSFGIEVMVNDGVLYQNGVLTAFGGKTYFIESLIDSEYRAAPYFVYGWYGPVIYDQEGGRFLSSYNAKLTEYASLNNINKDLLYMDFGADFYNGICIFRDSPDDDANRYLYNVDFAWYEDIANVWDISSFTGITDAEVFEISQRSPFVYYASGDKVYCITYDPINDTAGSNSTEVWSGPANGEEITTMKLCPFPGKNLSENVLDRYLFVATYNESTNEGKVYLFRVNIESNGALSSSPEAVYEGFGKIKEMNLKF